MTVQAAANTTGNNCVWGTGQNNTNVPPEDLHAKLQKSNVWDFSGYFNGGTASTACQG